MKDLLVRWLAACVVLGAMTAPARAQLEFEITDFVGKRTPVDDYPVQGRGGQGVIAIQTTARNGRTVGAVLVGEGDEIMLISSNGTLIRTPVDDISIQGRNTQGVRLIRVEEGQRLVGVARIEPMGEEEE